MRPAWHGLAQAEARAPQLLEQHMPRADPSWMLCRRTDSQEHMAAPALHCQISALTYCKQTWIYIKNNNLQATYAKSASFFCEEHDPMQSKGIKSWTQTKLLYPCLIKDGVFYKNSYSFRKLMRNKQKWTYLPLVFQQVKEGQLHSQLAYCTCSKCKKDHLQQLPPKNKELKKLCHEWVQLQLLQLILDWSSNIVKQTVDKIRLPMWQCLCSCFVYFILPSVSVF